MRCQYFVLWCLFKTVFAYNETQWTCPPRPGFALPANLSINHGDIMNYQWSKFTKRLILPQKIEMIYVVCHSSIDLPYHQGTYECLDLANTFRMNSF